jgi:hypothetical protein
MSGDIDAYAWLYDTPIAEAGALALVRNSDLGAVAEALGGDIASAETADLDGIFDESIGFEPVAALVPIGEWTLIAENNGWQAARPEVLRKLSVGTEAVGWYWCGAGNLPPYLTYAVDGTVIVTVSEFYEQRDGARPDALDEHLAAVGWDVEDNHGWISPALATRVTGVVIRPEMLEGDLTVVPILPWPEDIPDTPEHVVRNRYASMLDTADEPRLRAIACAAVATAAHVAGVTDLATVIAGDRGGDTLAYVERRSRALGPSGDWPRFRTYEAARACLRPDPMVAATHAIGSAQLALYAAINDISRLEEAVRRARFGDGTDGTA